MYDKSSINILHPGMMGGCVLKEMTTYGRRQG